MMGLGGMPSSLGSIRQGLMGSNPMAGPSGVMGPGGGMDVMGSLKQFGDQGAQYANNPMAGSFMNAGATPFGRGGGFMGF